VSSEELAKPADDGFVKADRMLQRLAMSLLRLGVQLDVNKVKDNGWLGLIRQLYLVSALGGSHYIAVAGEQGAGKTRLTQNLYPAAAEWLDDNPGRGEKNPVAIVERTDLTTARGIVVVRRTGADAVRCGELTEEIVYTAERAEEWREKVRGIDGNVLMAKLEVPAGFWGLNGTGLVLLPGLEVRGGDQVEKRHWQELMKIVLATSPGAILVVDERRMANPAQHKLLAQLRRGGQEPRFVVAVSKCEDSGDRAVAERVARAAEVFAIDPADVVPSGLDGQRPKNWVATLRERVDRIRPSATDSHQLQSSLLRGFVQTELEEVLVAARQARDLRALDTAASDMVDNLLEEFDTECDRIRTRLARSVHRSYAQHMNQAKPRLTASLTRTGGGKEIRARIGDALSFQKNNRNIRLTKLVEDAWWGPETEESGPPAGPNHAYLLSIRDTADSVWQVVGPAFTASLSDGRMEPGVGLALTGRAREDVERLPDLGQFKVLIGRTGALSQAVKALPAIALYARAFAIDLAQPDGSIPQLSQKDLAGHINDMAQERKELLAALGLLLGSETLAESDIDLLANAVKLGSSIFGTAGAGAGAEGAAAVASGAMLATIGVGAVAAVLINAGNKAMAERDRLAHGYLEAYREAAERSVLENVDDILLLTRDVLRARLQTALNTDERLNAQFDLLAAARGVEDIRARILEALGNDELA
jgi:hypothetical protein